MMMPSFKLTAVLALFAAAATSVTAAPLSPISDMVFNPTITSPKAGDVWTPGQTVTVTWETDNIPTVAQSYTGTLDLGHPDANSMNIETDRPLASGFKYSAGAVSFVVPNELVQRSNYAVFLFGDSGNKSPFFTM
ncbi:hypothetical protein HWV62_3843 [Athelia sp. TMB]|nr:hypothetical protein HWV62_3843 [Athelia sp. TMB]